MSRRWIIPCIVLAALTLLVVATTRASSPVQEPDVQTEMLGTTFTYQGQLKLDGRPVDNTCDFQFTLYDDEMGNVQVGATQAITGVQVAGGLFTVQLDFGADAFQGDARWLGIEVQCQGDTGYADLGTQELTATPYALYASTAPWNGISDMPAGFADGVDDVGLTSITWTDILSRPLGLDDGDDDTVYTAGMGLVLTDTEFSVDFTTVAPLTHTHNFTGPDVLKHFEQQALIPTNGAYDWESFMIEDDAYLAVANYSDGVTPNIDSRIYRWNGISFTETQAISTNSARDWEFFTIGDDAYLAVANCYNGSTYNIDSKIYRWDGASFTETQAIATNGAVDWKFFAIGSDYYLAVANYYNDVTHNIDSKVYKWNGSSFTETQSISTSGASDWEFFTIGDDFYLAVANAYDDSSRNIDSKIYQWDGAGFVEFQSIPTSGASDWEFFTIGDDAYLVVANRYNDSAYNIDSKIYQWDGTSFTEFQSIPTSGARDWRFFTLGYDAYLVVANETDGSASNIDSWIYRWRGTGFMAFQPVPTSRANDWEFFVISSDFYLVVANRYADSSSNPNIDSKVYKAKLKDCCRIVDPQPSYVQLDALISAPPAADCDQDTEWGRMKVDVVNSRLYICTHSGWTWTDLVFQGGTR